MVGSGLLLGILRGVSGGADLLATFTAEGVKVCVGSSGSPHSQEVVGVKESMWVEGSPKGWRGL